MQINRATRYIPGGSRDKGDQMINCWSQAWSGRTSRVRGLRPPPTTCARVGHRANVIQAAAATVIVIDVSFVSAVLGVSGAFTRTHLAVTTSELASAPSAQASAVQLSISTSSPLLVALSLEFDSSDVVGAVVAVLSEDDKSGVEFSTFVMLEVEGLVDIEVSDSESDGDDSFGVSGSGFTVFLVEGRRLFFVDVFC